MTLPFRVDFVPGVTPDKWLRTWASRFPETPLEATPVEDVEALPHLRDGSASMALLRLPVEREGLHVIPLYEEVPVVVVAKEHVVAAFDEVDVSDLAGEVLLQDPAQVPEWAQVASDDVRERAASMPVMTTKQAISVAAAGSGIVVVPMSVARLHHRKDVVHRPVVGVAPSSVGLAWRVDDEDPRIEDFIGIVRGRTARSSRGSAAPATEDTRDGRGAGDAGGRHTSSDGRRQDRGRTLPQRGAAPRRRGGSTRGTGRRGRR